MFCKHAKAMKTKRVYIGIVGRRNQGKSSLVNALAGHEVAIVSEVAGTTTDPVRKSMEVFGIGPVVLVDTAGIDDEGTVGQKRIARTMEVLKTLDAAILLTSGNMFGEAEQRLVERLKALDVPFVIAHNKSDEQPLHDALRTQLEAIAPVVDCSAAKNVGIKELTDVLVRIIPPSAYKPRTLLGDVVREGDLVVLVMPQDSEAPEGRLILPQVQVIRDLLDNGAVAIGLQPAQLEGYLKRQLPDLVVTDSQVFADVAPLVPAHVPLTSFSVVLARAKGNFDRYLAGTPTISTLKDGDRVLILESCTHATSCEDIGRVKLPALLRKFTGKQIDCELVASLSPLPENLGQFALAIQCGGCMVTEKQLANRVQQVVEAGVPVSNYGMAIAYMTGIFERITAMFRR